MHPSNLLLPHYTAPEPVHINYWVGCKAYILGVHAKKTEIEPCFTSRQQNNLRMVH